MQSGYTPSITNFWKATSWRYGFQSADILPALVRIGSSFLLSYDFDLTSMRRSLLPCFIKMSMRKIEVVASGEDPPFGHVEQLVFDRRAAGVDHEYVHASARPRY